MMTIEDITTLFIRGVGASEDSEREKWLHINHAYREVSVKLDVIDLYLANHEIETVPEQDWVPIDPEIRSIEQVKNMNDGLKMKKEPSGFKGRSRYYEPDFNRPPLGSPAFWVHKANRIWLRDTPDVPGVILSVDAKLYPPELSDATDPCEHLIIPSDYDLAIVQIAMSSFYQIHPPSLPDGTKNFEVARNYQAAASELLNTHNTQVQEENRDTHHYTRQLGYCFNPTFRF